MGGGGVDVVELVVRSFFGKQSSEGASGQWVVVGG